MRRCASAASFTAFLPKDYVTNPESMPPCGKFTPTFEQVSIFLSIRFVPFIGLNSPHNTSGPILAIAPKIQTCIQMPVTALPSLEQRHRSRGIAWLLVGLHFANVEEQEY